MLAGHTDLDELDRWVRLGDDARGGLVGSTVHRTNIRPFGVDLNLAANRPRIIGDAGQNLRHNMDDPIGQPAAGTTADGTLTHPPATTPRPASPMPGVADRAMVLPSR
jgi:hypothetical protein